MTYPATLRYARISPRKVRPLADMIRGLLVDEALDILAAAGAGFGHLNGWIEPVEIAFPGATMGVWMVVMAVLGGKGTLWGPVIGAVIFHVTQELFWIYLFGWQRVALGVLIVVIVVFFPEGVMGYLRQRRPDWFGETVAEADDAEGGR